MYNIKIQLFCERASPKLYIALPMTNDCRREKVQSFIISLISFQNSLSNCQTRKNKNDITALGKPNIYFENQTHPRSANRPLKTEQN